MIWAGGKNHGETRPFPSTQERQVNHPRPRLISFESCTNVLVEGLTLTNSPSWTLHPFDCENVTVTKVTIVNPANSPNTDGINPESCRNVHIANCHVDVGEDCVTTKSGTEHDREHLSPCENITITNCTMVHGHGGVVIGSEMSGDVRNVVISNCVFVGAGRGIRQVPPRARRRGRGHPGDKRGDEERALPVYHESVLRVRRVGRGQNLGQEPLAGERGDAPLSAHPL